MKNFVLRIILVFAVVVGVTFLMLNYIFFNQNAPKSKATGETMTLSFNPATATLGTDGQEATTIVKVKPSVVMVARGYYFKVTFDKAKVQIKDITYKLGVVSAGLGQTNADLAKINTDGFIVIQGEDNTVAGVTFANTTSFIDVVSIKFSRRVAGGNNLTIDKDNVSFYRSITENNTLAVVKGTSNAVLAVNGGVAVQTYKCSCTAAYGACGNFADLTNIKYRECTLNTSGADTCILSGGRYYNYLACTAAGTPTTAAGMVNAKLKMKLKFQGIGAKPGNTALNSMSTRVKLFDETTSTATSYQAGTFVSGDNGVWSGEVTFSNINPAHKYAINVKGPRHLQKKVCVAVATETQGGTYRCSAGAITLVSGDNNIDLSGVLLLGGDLPVADQDGAVTAIDTSFIRNNLNTTDATLKGKCDINLDDRCDTQDYSLVIGSLSIKNDEE